VKHRRACGSLLELWRLVVSFARRHGRPWRPASRRALEKSTTEPSSPAASIPAPAAGIGSIAAASTSTLASRPDAPCPLPASRSSRQPRLRLLALASPRLPCSGSWRCSKIPRPSRALSGAGASAGTIAPKKGVTPPPLLADGRCRTFLAAAPGLPYAERVRGRLRGGVCTRHVPLHLCAFLRAFQ